jgi:UDP-GlcNAc:undecaprenyl-phosphate/decaprenyl-phosphate GlcNAc-1-phosphate transferase
MAAPGFPYVFYVAALAAGALTTWLALPLWRRWCLSTGLIDHPGHRKIHETPVPLAGGLAVLSGLLLPLLGAALLLALLPGGFSAAAALSQGMSQRAVQIAAIAAGAVGITLVGMADDRHVMSAKKKFSGQLAVAVLLVAADVRVTLFLPGAALSCAVTVLWVLTVINAFNFMDNMNGLCAGLGAIGAFLFGVFGAAAGQYLVASFAFMMCGALLGFLPHNFPEARAFLGDSGSHLVGYMLAVMAILPHFHRPDQGSPLAVLSPLLILAVPLLDMAWVVLWRLWNGKPFYVGDTNHLSHRLVRRGLSRRDAVLLIWLAAALIGSLALL